MKCNSECPNYQFVKDNLGYCKQTDLDQDNPLSGLVLKDSECFLEYLNSLYKLKED